MFSTRKSKIVLRSICFSCLMLVTAWPCWAHDHDHHEDGDKPAEAAAPESGHVGSAANDPAPKTLEERVRCLEKQFKDMGDVFEGHKRHPLRNIFNLQIAGGLTGVVQGSGMVPLVKKDDPDIWKTESRGGGTGTMDLIVKFPVSDTALTNIYFWAGAGDGLQPLIEEGIHKGLARKHGLADEPELTLLHGINDTATKFGEPGNPNLALREAWYEQNWFDNKLTFTIGKVDLTNYLETNAVANDGIAQFVSSGFTNNLAVDFPDTNGPGFRLTACPADILQITLGVANAKAEWGNIFNHGFEMLEVDLTPKFGELQGNYRFYGWLSDKDHEDFRKVEDNPEDDNQKLGNGYGISADQQLPGNITLFGRIGWADKNIYAVDIAWSAGGQITGEVWGRKDDAFGVAYGQAHLNRSHPDWESLRDDKIKIGDEHQVEAYYKIAVNDSVIISPDIIYIKNPAGVAETKDIWVYGLRAHVHF